MKRAHHLAAAFFGSNGLARQGQLPAGLVTIAVPPLGIDWGDWLSAPTATPPPVAIAVTLLPSLLQKVSASAG